MDIRRLFKSTCPLAKRYHSTSSSFGSSILFQPRLACQRRDKFKRTTGSTYFHANNVFMRQCTHSGSGNQFHQIRQRSTFYSPERRTSRRVPDRSQAPAFHSRSNPPNHHRTQKPSLLNWRQRQNNRSSSSSSPLSGGAGELTAGETKTKSPDLVPSPVAPPNNSTQPGFYQIKRISSPIRGMHLVNRRRRRAALYRFRLQRQLRNQKLSVPQPSSQLLGLGGNTSTAIGRTNQWKTPKRAKKGGGTSSHTQDDTNLSQYQHVHYYSKKSKLGRKRLLGFQNFLRSSRANSSRGQRAYERAEAAMRLRSIIQQRNAKHSWTRPFVRRWKKRLDQLEELLDAGDAVKAIKAARELIRAKCGGAELPNGKQFLRLVKMDEAHYVNPPPISARAAMWGKKQGGRFNTKDINTILEYCINVRDLGNGVNISHILLKRYQSPKFDFQSEVSAPNARTIDLLFKMLINCRQWRKAERFLACLHKRYPRPIPVDNYAAILNKLAPVPDQIHFMKSILSHLEEHGPAPTVTLYNTFLKAHAIHTGAESAEEYLKSMLKLNQAADRQSFRILIEASLKELDLARAHYWLAEYARQGFEIPPRMMDPFVRTCIQQLRQDKGGRSRTKGAHPADTDAYSKEWMHKALHLVQFMTNQRIRPTATTFELLIEGFLLQGNLTDARKVLHQMRGSPHLYTPAPRTWTLFFEHYLSVNDHMSALKILNEMRHALSLTPFRTQSTVVPTKLYHQLFRHLLKCGKLSLAERSLYEMMIHQNRRQPSEPEAIDLIWKLDRQPEAAERVYELLYSQAREPESSMSILPPGSRYVRTNRILERGPIQMANVGLMRARANSTNETLHLEVWKSWSDMTAEFLERQYERLPSDQHDLRTTQKDVFVLASAFEQVAKASRKLYRKPSVFKDPNQVKEQAQDTEEGDHVARGWDFGQIRRNLGPGLSLGLGLGLGGSSGASSLPVIGKHRLLIQRLLQQREILKPLLDRHEALSESGTAISTKTGDSDYTAERNADEIRLENLKRSFDWVQEHRIPIRIEGLNAYIESLLSHKDFDEAKSCVERFLLLSDSAPPVVGSEDEASSSKTLTTTTNSPLPPLGPDVATIQIFYNRKNRKSKISEDLMHRLLFKGGPRLVNEWTNHLEGLQARSSPVEI